MEKTPEQLRPEGPEADAMTEENEMTNSAEAEPVQAPEETGDAVQAGRPAREQGETEEAVAQGETEDATAEVPAQDDEEAPVQAEPEGEPAQDAEETVGGAPAQHAEGTTAEADGQTSKGDEAQAAPQLEFKEKVGVVEAILFVTGDAVETRELCRALDITELELTSVLDALESGYDFDRRGLRLLRFGSHVQLATRPEYAPYVERLLQPVQKQSLSQAVMETLAVIAYRQPVTKGEIEQVRGVKCDYSVQALVSRGLIEEIGRRETLGRPILYGTTDAFLRHFALGSLSDLPSIDFSRLAGKLGAQQEAAEAEIPLTEMMNTADEAMSDMP